MKQERPSLSLGERLHALHRFWRYRLNSERDSVRHVLGQPLEGATVLDIGANRGIYSYWLSKQVGPTGRVIAVEPQPELGGYLQRLTTAFALDNVTIENVALSDRAGTCFLQRPHVGAGGASITESSESQYDGMTTVEIRTQTLDELVESLDLPRISFIKCDVEGHELNVFRGGQKTLQRDKPQLLFEGHHFECEEGSVFRQLEEWGYEGCFFVGRQAFPHTRFADFPYRPNRRLRNYVFTHPSGATPNPAAAA